ncbi:MAG: hypothetical protein A3I01_16805 [Betaproteobacteria bacterium RIFCSPLOWO2_02_FULL_65_24]|nr:MAG: hypothetical protein A3I01_16805 [Betaproteobacteria bacterium RIFCSPLOWO2_02_FULL_65_24]OGA95630.1 MAG: hypothetical protein A3G27_15965 [Betaproteobacteria bacterium RIFCSPLOWO2_12_FULL_66_14]
MKLYTPDKVELMEITSIASSPEGLVIDGMIMGAMPMKAVLTPREFHRAFRLLSLRTMLTMVGMLLRR